MPLPSNGITPEVIRDIMPPYRLNEDLMAATFAALPAPPPDATPAWRHARITRLLTEIATLKPADAAQARIASHVLIVRGLTDTIAARAQAPDLPIDQICRIARTTTELVRAATALERTLARHQQTPVPFYGTVVQDEVDIPALDALWVRTPAFAGAGSPHSDAAGSLASAGAEPKPTPADKPRPDAAPPPDAASKPVQRFAAPPPNQPDIIPPPAAPAPSAPPPPPAAAPEAPAQRAPDPAVRAVRPAGSSPDWVIEQLDQGPGWSREVLRPRTAADPAPGAAP